MKCYLIIPFILFYLFCTAQYTTITGKVYVDENKNVQLDKTEIGLPNVLVSNGVDVVVTNEEGLYEIEVREGMTIFTIKPSGYSEVVDATGFSTNYFHYYSDTLPTTEFPGLKTPTSFSEKVNFGLWRQIEPDTFKVAMLGDLQMRIQEEINYTNRLLTPEIYKRKDLAFTVLLGDIADDNLHILNGTKQITRNFGIPTYPIFGNHDRNMETNPLSIFTSTFKQNFGPDYYSFNYGQVHFIAINDIYPTEDGGYKGQLTDEHLIFIKNDLAHVPKNQLLVFLQHIPLYTIANIDTLLSIIADRPNTLAISGHRHIMEQEFLTYGQKFEMHEVVAGAVGGLWWDGERDWKGIPVAVMGGGAPKGYYVFTFAKNTYQMQYKALELPVSKQINIWVYEEERGDPGVIKPANFQGNEVLVNVFAGSERTSVKMRINDGEWQSLAKTEDHDQFIARIIRLEALGIYPTQNQNCSYLKKEPSKHIWKGYYPADLPKGSHKIEVIATDKYGLDAYEVRFFTIGLFDK